MLSRFIDCAVNALDRYSRLVVAGLNPWSEIANPRLANDNYWALLSLYDFARRRWPNRKRILDAGCGPGYGTAHLAAGSAAEVIGVDLDPANVRFARRNYARPGMEFRRKDVQEAFGEPDCSFDAIFSSNVLEHLQHPESFLLEMSRLLQDGGEFVLAFPPIIDSTSMEVNRRIRFHRSNRYVADWLVTLRGCFGTVTMWTHSTRDGVRLDLTNSRHRTSRSLDDFVFRPADLAEIESGGTMTALFVLHGPRR